MYDQLQYQRNLDAQIKDLVMLSFLEGSIYPTKNDHLFNKENAYFDTVNIQAEYFRGYENICCMVFPKNMLMTLSHMVFNISLDFIYGQCYPLHGKTRSFCFTFVLIIVNPIILVLVLKLLDERYLL